MNYYPHHIGDYAKDAGHVSMIEDGAYRRMMDAYYSTEKPLPLDRKALYRLVRTQSKAERDAVDVILKEFFKETPEGWWSKRCEEEIANAREKSAKASASAAKRWHSDGNADAMRTHSEGNAPNNQEPITNNQRKTSRKRDLPPDFAITERVRKWAAENGFTRLDAHYENFVSQCRAKGYTYADWDEGFMGAIRKDWAKLGTTPDPMKGVE